MANISLGVSDQDSRYEDDYEKLKKEIFQLRLRCYDYHKLLENCKCNRNNEETTNENTQMNNILLKYRDLMNENQNLKEENNLITNNWRNYEKKIEDDIAQFKTVTKGIDSKSSIVQIIEFNNLIVDKYMESNRKVISLTNKVKLLEKERQVNKRAQNESIANITLNEIKKDFDINASLDISRSISKKCPECDNYKFCYDQISSELVKSIIETQNLQDELNNKTKLMDKMRNDIEIEIVNQNNADIKKFKKYLISTFKKIEELCRDSHKKEKLIDFYKGQMVVLSKDNDIKKFNHYKIFNKLISTCEHLIKYSKNHNSRAIDIIEKKFHKFAIDRSKKCDPIIDILQMLIRLLVPSISKNISCESDKSKDIKSIDNINNISKHNIEAKSIETVNKINATMDQIKELPNRLRDISPQHIKTVENFAKSSSDFEQTFASNFEDNFSFYDKNTLNILDEVYQKLENLGGVIQDYVKQIEVVDLNKTLHISQFESTHSISEVDNELQKCSSPIFSDDFSVQQAKLQELYDLEKQQYFDEIEANNQKALQFEEKNIELSSKIQSLEEEKSILENKIVKLKHVNRDISTNYHSLQNSIDELNEKLNLQIDQNDKLKIDKENKIIQLNEVNEENNNLKQLFEEKEKELIRLNAFITENDHLKTLIKENEKELDRLNILIKEKDQFKLMIQEKQVENQNKLSELTKENEDLRSEIELKNNFVENIESKEKCIYQLKEDNKIIKCDLSKIEEENKKLLDQLNNLQKRIDENKSELVEKVAICCDLQIKHSKEENLNKRMSLEIFKIYQKFLSGSGLCEISKCNLSCIDFIEIDVLLRDFTTVLNCIYSDHKSKSANKENIDIVNSINQLESVKAINSHSFSKFSNEYDEGAHHETFVSSISSSSDLHKLSSNMSSSVDYKDKYEKCKKRMLHMRDKYYDNDKRISEKYEGISRTLDNYICELNRCKEHLKKALKYLPAELKLEVSRCLN